MNLYYVESYGSYWIWTEFKTIWSWNYIWDQKDETLICDGNCFKIFLYSNSKGVPEINMLDSNRHQRTSPLVCERLVVCCQVRGVMFPSLLGRLSNWSVESITWGFGSSLSAGCGVSSVEVHQKHSWYDSL